MWLSEGIVFLVCRVERKEWVKFGVWLFVSDGLEACGLGRETGEEWDVWFN